MKKERKTKSDYTSKMPNEQHRAEKWSGARIEVSKKSYRRKSKYKKDYSEI